MQVFREGIVVVARGWLAGLAEASAVIGEDAVTCGQECRELFLPRGTIQRVPCKVKELERAEMA